MNLERKKYAAFLYEMCDYALKKDKQKQKQNKTLFLQVLFLSVLKASMVECVPSPKWKWFSIKINQTIKVKCWKRKKKIFWPLDSMKLAVESQLEIHTLHSMGLFKCIVSDLFFYNNQNQPLQFL